MEDYDNLIYALEKSVEKHGEKPLTNKWLLNLLKMVQKNMEEDDRLLDIFDFDSDMS